MNQRQNEVQAYATAFLEATFEEALAALQAVYAAISKEASLYARLVDPAQDLEAKYTLVRKLVPPGTGEAVINFLGLLISRQDLGSLGEIIKAVQEQAQEEAEMPTVAEVISAVPLTDEERATLEEKLQARFGKRLTFEYHVSPDILGGMIVRVGDVLMDYSLLSRLEGLRHRLEEVV